MSFLGNYTAYFVGISIASIAFLLVAVFVLPYLIGLLPSNYFAQEDRPIAVGRHPLLRLLGKVLKNILGLIILLMGIVMLITPGQGLLSIIVGLLLLDYPGKFQFEKRLIQTPYLLTSVNWIRRKQGKEEFHL